MDAIERKIGNSNSLTDIFGCWPSFHDAEVISIELQRAQGGLSEPTLTAKIYLFEMTSKVDERGCYVLKNHTIVTFSFKGIDESCLKWFNQQNSLWELAILDISSRQLEKLKFQVHFSSSFGVEAEFKCRAIEILSADRTDLVAVEGFPRQLPPKAGAYEPN